MRFSLTPDILFNTRQARQNVDLRARLETAGQEAITGRRSDVLDATGGRIGDAYLLDKASLDIERQQATIGLAKARLNGAAASLKTVREGLSTISADGRVILSQGGPNDLAQFAENAADRLRVTMNALSTRSGTRHLFSGTNTTGVPLAPPADLQAAVNAEIGAAPDVATAIAAVDTYFNGVGGGFETNIYQGSVADGPRLHVADDRSYDPIPKGDDPLFRDVMRGYAMIAGAMQFTDQDDQRAMMTAGLSLLESSLGGAIAMETSLGASQQSIERIEQSFTREASVIRSAQTSLLGRDAFEAASEVQALEAQLQASYTITGRLGSLSLANFLR